MVRAVLNGVRAYCGPLKRRKYRNRENVRLLGHLGPDHASGGGDARAQVSGIQPAIVCIKTELLLDCLFRAQGVCYKGLKAHALALSTVSRHVQTVSGHSGHTHTTHGYSVSSHAAAFRAAFWLL